MEYLKSFKADPRHFQIATLASLLMFLFIWNDFAPSLTVIALTLSGTLLTQLFFFKVLKIKSNDYRSPLITSLSLALLFKTNLIWLYPLAGALAMASKFIIRWDNKHLFNPANAAIVFMLMLAPNLVWVSPGQWGNAAWLGFALICLAILVLSRARRADMAVFFLIAWSALLLARAAWLGDPLVIPIHNLQSGALLIFAFFMISDPMTTPNNRWGRLLFAVSVAVVAYILQYVFQVREAIFYALFIICMTTPLIDFIFKNHAYKWSNA